MRNRRMIRFAAAGSPRMARFVAMQRGRATPADVSPIARTRDWLKGIVLGGPAQVVRP